VGRGGGGGGCIGCGGWILFGKEEGRGGWMVSMLGWVGACWFGIDLWDGGVFLTDGIWEKYEIIIFKGLVRVPG